MVNILQKITKCFFTRLVRSCSASICVLAAKCVYVKYISAQVNN